MKIACLYFPTSSVGGIATNTAALRAEAKRRGDTFDVLVSANTKTHQFQIFLETKRIRGGDTFIDVDGYASHHIFNAATSAKKINELYDLVYLAFLCPHPTKAYGKEPIFESLLSQIELPIVGRISDGYYETYREFGDATAALCDRMVIAYEHYLPEGFKERFPKLPIVYGRPFEPMGKGYDAKTDEATRSKDRTLCWISQFKNIKGIGKFIKLLPEIPGRQFLFSNGIEYYKLRQSEEWKRAVGLDKFAGFNGEGKATFYGWQPQNVIRKVLRYCHFTPEFQGFGKPKNEAYRKGSTNNTNLEALFEGCTPVIPSIVIKSAGIPPESCIGVDDWNDVIPALSGSRAPRPDLGKAWVLENFHTAKIYERFFGVFR